MTDPASLSDFVKQKALELGFDGCGIARAGKLKEEEPRLSSWLISGFHGSMDYMANHFEKRLDPAKLVEGARSVIVLALNYCPARSLPEDSDYLISRYAYGNDYHEIIHEKLNTFIAEIKAITGTEIIRGFVDSAPVLEKSWGVQAGLGWIGKNSLLILPKKGSWFFLAEIITDIEMEYEDPYTANYCSACSRCIDACPTHAITGEGVVKADRCISYLTIENKGKIPDEFNGKYDQWIFGCDICQQVCPWNRVAVQHQHSELIPVEGLFAMTKTDWEKLDESGFEKLFGKSAIKRTKFAGLSRNINFLKSHSSPG